MAKSAKREKKKDERSFSEKWLFGEEIPNTGATRPNDPDESQPK